MAASGREPPVAGPEVEWRLLIQSRRSQFFSQLHNWDFGLDEI